MAGFFGLFNYEKEGPGIRKDAPRKKTFIVFFETFFRNFWKFIPINLIFTVFFVLFPVSGLGFVGLTHVTRNIARDKHSFGLSDFFETIKKNWKQALPAGIINTVVLLLLAFDLYFFWQNAAADSNLFHSVCLGIGFAVLIVFLMMNFYIWTLMITFNFKLSQIYRNSFKFVFINFKMNLLCGVILIAFYAIGQVILWLVPHMLVWTLLFLFTICCVPAFRFLLVQFCTFPAIKKFIIDPYYAEHPGEDIEKRRNLGLEIAEEEPGEDDEDADGDSSDDEEDDPNAPVFED